MILAGCPKRALTGRQLHALPILGADPTLTRDDEKELRGRGGMPSDHAAGADVEDADVRPRLRPGDVENDGVRAATADRLVGMLAETEADIGVEAEEFHGAPILAHVVRKIRVVIAKPGLDGHDRGAKIIARALRDAGMEVIYTGLHQTPEQIVETALQEDADAVGISILSGAHMTLVPRILDGLKENGADDVLVVVGGTIPTEDAEELKRLGVAAVFTPGAPTSEIVDFLRAKVPA